MFAGRSQQIERFSSIWPGLQSTIHAAHVGHRKVQQYVIVMSQCSKFLYRMVKIILSRQLGSGLD